MVVVLAAATAPVPVVVLAVPGGTKGVRWLPRLVVTPLRLVLVVLVARAWDPKGHPLPSVLLHQLGAAAARPAGAGA